MKVKELYEILKNEDPDKKVKVFVPDYSEGYLDISSVNTVLYKRYQTFSELSDKKLIIEAR